MSRRSSTRRARALVVGCGFPQVSLIRAFRALGVTVVGADANPAAIGAAEADVFARASTADPAALHRALAEHGCDAIATTGSEVALKSVARVAAEAGLPFYADPDTVRRCQDKDLMRSLYREAGLAVPAFARVESREEACAHAADLGYPLVVKPARGWGQRAVARVDAPDELDVAVQSALDCSDAQGLRVAVVEQWVEGIECSVNGWVEDGELVAHCVTQRVTFPGRRPLGVMLAEVTPAGLRAREEALVVGEARRGARALGLDRGPCYSQVVLGPDGPVLLETAARCGGGFDADVTRLVSGVDHYARLAGVALGDVSLERSAGVPAARAALVRFLSARPGSVERVEGLAEALALPGVRAAEVFVRAGDSVAPLTDASKRAGYVLVDGESRDEAVARAFRAARQIAIVTREDGRGGSAAA